MAYHTYDRQSYTKFVESDVCRTLAVRAHMTTGGDEALIVNDEDYVVRRLTLKECARLQGFPDDWCDGVDGPDTAQYTMWGNGMALPCILYLMQGMAEVLTEDENSA